MVKNRPQTTVILAMTADGKIADFQSNPARFGSQTDKAHLEEQIALVDGVLFGAKTLQAYGTTLPLKNPQLLAQRQQQNKPPQPIFMVVSASGNIDLNLPFFAQAVPRWLITTTEGAKTWEKQDNQGFEKVIITQTNSDHKIDWNQTLETLDHLGLHQLAILGGGTLVASLLEVNLIDELWLTVCPLLLGGMTSPTPVEGIGFLSSQAKWLQLLSVKQVEQEIFLHYRLHS